MQYNISFIMTLFATFCIGFLDYLAIWVLLKRFGSIGGWNLLEISLLYALTYISFSLTDFLLRGLDRFASQVKTGSFDRLLLRPVNLLLQVAVQDISLIRVGKLLQAISVLVWAIYQLQIDWNVFKVTLFFYALLSGVLLFGGLFIIQATISFWTIESLEIFNILTHGGCEAASYPMNIYKPWFYKLFTYFVPLTCTSYLPIVAILEKPEHLLGFPLWFAWVSPTAACLFFLLSLKFWRLGVKHYCSTGN